MKQQFDEMARGQSSKLMNRMIRCSVGETVSWLNSNF
jgi:hypothetical protein